MGLSGSVKKAVKKPAPRAGKADEEDVVLAAIAEMSEPHRSMGKRLHTIIRANAPTLTPRLWYGMPAYARDGKVVCFFRGSDKFKERYMTFGFDDSARLDDGAMWPIAYALTGLTGAEEARVAELVKKATG
jgi:uncharacterized protein YdhG (YjbR/CyaY superfamily)